MRSVKQLFIKLQPSYSAANITLALKSQRKAYVLVEGDWDCRLYRKLLTAKPVNVGKAEQDGKGGWHYVEQIVAQVKAEIPKAKVVGIRDRDYTHYDASYHKPDDIYLTDEHSLEMMLLHSEAVRKALTRILSDFDEVYSVVLDGAREMAQYYVYSTLENLAIDFKEKRLHLADFTDKYTGKLQAGWKQNLQDGFFAEFRDYSVAEMSRKLNYAGFYNADNYEVCRGHDVLDVLYSSSKHGSYEKDDVMNLMVTTYSDADFKKTRLAADLDSFFRK